MEQVVVWFKLNSEGFSKINLREEQVRRLIHLKLKGFFANFLEPWRLDCGLIWKSFGFFSQKDMRDEAGLWVNFTKYEEAGLQIDFAKYGGLFLQNDPSSSADPTAGKSPRWRTERSSVGLFVVVGTTGHGFDSWNRTREPQLRDLFRIFVDTLSRVEPQRDCDVPVAYRALMVPVISRKTRSSNLCVVIDLVVHV
jgi:hypothetical protein